MGDKSSVPVPVLLERLSRYLTLSCQQVATLQPIRFLTEGSYAVRLAPVCGTRTFEPSKYVDEDSFPVLNLAEAGISPALRPQQMFKEVINHLNGRTFSVEFGFNLVYGLRAAAATERYLSIARVHAGINNSSSVVFPKTSRIRSAMQELDAFASGAQLAFQLYDDSPNPITGLDLTRSVQGYLGDVISLLVPPDAVFYQKGKPEYRMLFAAFRYLSIVEHADRERPYLQKHIKSSDTWLGRFFRVPQSYEESLEMVERNVRTAESELRQAILSNNPVFG